MGPVKRKYQVITSPFGKRGDIMHKGIDLRSIRFSVKGLSLGDHDLVACEKCLVRRQGVDGYGNNYLVVEPLTSNIFGYTEIKYIHISKTDFTTGQILEEGDYIGKAILGGNSLAKHLHFETWKGGDAVDPVKYLNDMLIAYKTKDGKFNDEG